MRRLSGLLALTALLSLPVKAEDSGAGSAHYKRCSACHLADGAGIPGSFPPLNALPETVFSTESGRQYLVMVLSKGLSGSLTSGGVPYFGAMPAQGGWLKDKGIAEVLNFVMTDLNPGKSADPFTEEEVAGIRALLSAENQRGILKLRPDPATEPDAGASQ